MRKHQGSALCGHCPVSTMNLRPFILIAVMILAPMSQIVDVGAATSGRSIACTSDICLNELIPNPNGYDDDVWPNGEWIELYNNGSSAIDILNWELENQASKILVANSDSIVGYEAGNSSTWTIQPGDYLVVARNGSANFYMTNTGGYVDLLDSSGTRVDQASWSTTSSSGVSLEEDSANPTADWVPTNQPTPGSANSAATAPVAADLVFNEVMANPWPSADNASWPGGEWVELLNTGQNTIDLTGWSISDAAGNSLPMNSTHLIGSSMDIAPNEKRIVAVNGTTQWGVLNNGQETLTLKWPNGTTAQTISWTVAYPGFSLTNHPSGNWVPSAFPTPESENPVPWDMIVNGSSPIQISEVLPNATIDGAPVPDGEWVELHNTGTGNLDLQGWMIMDGMGNTTQVDAVSLVFNDTQPATAIAPDGRRLVQFIQGTELWNDYNHLMLFDQFGTVVSSSWWNNDHGENVSLIAATMPTDPWTPSAWPTPGQPEPGTSTVTGDVSFNEIFPDAVGNDSSSWPDGEWIELKNTGNISVDLTNWKLTAGPRTFSLSADQLPLRNDAMLNPGEIALVAINGSQGFYLRNTNPDTIELRDHTNQIISSMTYNQSTEGESIWMWQGDWSQAPWPTPGMPNPQTSPYTGQTTVSVTEVLAHCSDGSITPDHDWIELLNNGSENIDLSAWRMESDDGELFHVRTDRMWNSSSTIIAPGQRAVITLPMWFISGYGGSFTLEDPDGNPVDFVSWTITTDCITMSHSGETLPWPTPGQPEPDISSFAGPDDLIFSRFMFEEKSQTTNDEFFEISNIGVLPAILDGWQIQKQQTGGSSFNGTFTSVMISPGESVIISPDASGVKGMGDTIVLDADDVMDYPIWLPDSGATIGLVAPDGTVADSFVYGNGPTSVEGWSGVAIAEPVTTIDRILYLRGDGCGVMPDTDTATDWQMRWSTAGASHFCSSNTFTDNTNVTALISPEDGLEPVLSWIADAQETIHLHVYQIHHPHLVQALIDAEASGVEVTVVVHEPEEWWGDYSVGQSIGMMWELEQGGAEVLQFSSSYNSPYAYIHSKVAVRDDSSVWIGSGNWKDSSLPADRTGNRDWGVIVDSVDLATIVLERMAFDEDPSQLHVEDTTVSQPDSGSYEPPSSWTGPMNAGVAVNGPISGELLTCPDDCIQGLTGLIDSADDEILLSLQSFEMDWYWGWGQNPLTDALQAAADRGVRIRLIINQHYANDNPDIREAVNELNEDWSGDIEAILMSENETVTKLHNKGVIVDGESVLISSINWGDNSILQNREMGLVIHSTEITAIYEASWWEDWNRLDNTTDTDLDGLPDKWEVENGLQRSRSGDELLDGDGDGLVNSVEYSYSSNPNSNDTDGDCIHDADEILWATTEENISSHDALTLADADADGTDDWEIIGCALENIDTTTPIDNTSGNGTDDNVTSSDSDGDGVIDSKDNCPGTPVGEATDIEGCTAQQNKDKSINDSNQGDESSGIDFMTWLIIGSGIILIGAGAILLLRKKDEDMMDDFSAPVKDFNVPVLDGAQMPVLDGSAQEEETGPDLSRFPGWTLEQVQSYMDDGWTEDQLAEWYSQQI